MTYLYHMTNKRNLMAIKSDGLAPAILRPPSLTRGATQQKREQSEAEERDKTFRSNLFRVAAKGYSISEIRSKPALSEGITFSRKDFGRVQEADYVHRVGGMSGQGAYPKQSESLGLTSAISDLNAMVEKYCKEMPKKSPPASKVKVSKDEIKLIDVDGFRGHFLYDLAYQYVMLTNDIEAEIARHRLYFFALDYLRSEYPGYVGHITGDYRQVAILQVKLEHVKEPKRDASQGNAITTKTRIDADKFRCKVAVDADAVRALDFEEAGWTDLTAYTELEEETTAAPIGVAESLAD